MPWQLSGGQMQRVAIARALVNKPSIILADEPTGNLDSRSSHVIMEELANLHKKGNTIVMVTHNPNLTSYASRVINMLDGKVASDRRVTVESHTESKEVAIPLHKSDASKDKNNADAKDTKDKDTKKAKEETKEATKDKLKKTAKKSEDDEK